MIVTVLQLSVHTSLTFDDLSVISPSTFKFTGVTGEIIFFVRSYAVVYILYGNVL